MKSTLSFLFHDVNLIVCYNSIKIWKTLSFTKEYYVSKIKGRYDPSLFRIFRNTLSPFYIFAFIFINLYWYKNEAKLS